MARRCIFVVVEMRYLSQNLITDYVYLLDNQYR